MNFERLENLIVAAEGADPERFDMRAFAHICGTPACLFGNYAARTDLQDRFMIEDGDVVLRNGIYCGFRHIREHFGWECARELVCDGEDFAAELFGTRGCGGAKTPAQAAAYVRAFIDRHKVTEVTP